MIYIEGEIDQREQEKGMSDLTSKKEFLIYDHIRFRFIG